MALIDMEEFGAEEMARIYIAGRLSEAKRVERTLSDRGVDYAVAIESFCTKRNRPPQSGVIVNRVRQRSQILKRVGVRASGGLYEHERNHRSD